MWDELDQKQLYQFASIRHRGPMLIKNMYRNLPYCGDIPHVASFGQFLRGHMAVIVGAGPSLEKNIECLAEYQDHAFIISVNTAAPALRKAGIRVDLVSAIESMDVSQHLEDEPVMASLTSHQSLWDRACCWVAEGSPATARMCMLWGARPAHMGVAAATAACSMAADWGASAIALVGMDLAGAKDGRMYAKGSAWETVTSEVKEVEGMGTRVVLNNPPERHEAFTKEGMQSFSDVRSAPIEIDAWDGGKIHTVGEFLTQLDWLKGWAHGQQAYRPVFNCTEGGARIEHMVHSPLWEVMRLTDDGKPTLPEGACVARNNEAMEDAVWQCQEAKRWARLYVSGQFFPCPLMPTIPAVSEASMPALIGVAERISAAARQGQRQPPVESISNMYRAMHGAAQHIETLLEERYAQKEADEAHGGDAIAIPG